MQETSVTMMQAFVIDAYGSPENGRVREMDAPRAGDGELLVRIRAASVNAFDYKLISGMYQQFMPLTFPFTPGTDGSGEVAAVGNHVEGWKVGDPVVGRFKSGTFAQYGLIAATGPEIAHMPKGLDFERAATIPVAGLTAKRMLRQADVAAGQTVLIVGATGGVGMYLIQLAKRAGAHVLATGKPGDQDFVRQLGADEMIDYAAGDVITQTQQRFPSGISAVFDLVDSGDALIPIARALGDNGTLVSALRGPDQTAFPAGKHIRYITDVASPLGDLDDLVKEATKGRLRIEIQRIYELAQAGQALADMGNTAKHKRGKLVVRVP
jgi:NADPH:quinone reductase